MLITHLAVTPGRGRPFTLPAVRALADGLDLTAPVTFLVGENGSGKSTILEAVADACGINTEGGKAGTKYSSTGPPTRRRPAHRAHHRRPAAHQGPPAWPAGVLLPGRDPVQPRPGRLRPARFLGGGPHRESHGEGFFTVLDTMVTGPSLYLMDEPEAVLSFASCLRLIALLDRAAGGGGQIICATHSPILASLPGAQILELDGEGIHPVQWGELRLVDHWRRYLARPDAYLRHILRSGSPRG